MDSVSNWGNNPAVKSELWGNISSVIGSSNNIITSSTNNNSGSTGSFAQQNSDRPSSGLGNPGSAWNSTGAKISQVSGSSNMWPSSEVSSSSKQDVVGKWGVGLSGGNGGGTTGGGQPGGQNDAEPPWRSGSTGSWTSNSEKNDISGWGSPNRSPVPNAGTEGWGSKPEDRLAAWSSSAESRSNNGYLQPDARQTSGSWSDAAGDRSKQSQWGTAGSSSSSSSGVPGSASGAWSRGNPIMQPSQSVPTLGNPQAAQQQQQGGPGSWAQAVTNKSGQSGGAGVGGAGGSSNPGGTPDDFKASNQRRSQEDLIAQAINSNDGWGKTTIRQDTAWVIEDAVVEQRKAPAVPEASSEEAAAHLARQVMTGTAIWESSKAVAASRAAEKSGEDRGAWSGTPVEKTSGGIAPAANPANGPTPAALSAGNNPASAFRPPVDKPPGNSWPPGPAAEKPSASWGGSSTSSEGSWEGATKKDENDRMWDLDSNKGSSASKTETGVWERPLRRSSSSGSWTGDEVENVGGGGWGEDKTGHPPEVDDGTSVWGDPSSQNRPQNWKHGQKQSGGGGGAAQFLGQRVRPPDERSDGFYGMPPPAGIGMKPSGFGDQMENAVGPWNPSVPPPKPDGAWGDGHWPGQQQRPPKSSSLGGAWDINDWMSIQSGSRRNDFVMTGVGGSKGPTPQRSVVLQQLLNMGFRKEDAQNALISNNMNLENAISELLANRLRVDPEVADLHRSRGLLRPNDELTSDASLDANSILFGLPSLGQLNNNPFGLGGAGANPQQVLANPMRPVGPASLQQFGSSLGNQQSTMPDFNSLLQRSNQVMNNSVFSPPQQQQQQQQLMQQLVQSIQSAIHLGLLPKQLVKPHMLTNHNFVVNVQRLLQLHEMHQKLSEQCQLIQRQHQGPVLSSAVQQHLLELTLTNVGLQQQIEQVKAQIVQMASVPPPSSVNPAMPPVDQLLKGLQIKDDNTPASRLMSQWKLDGDASATSDAKSIQHSVVGGTGSGLDMPTADATWLPMPSSSATSWSGVSSAADDISTVAASSSTDTKVLSSVSAAQTSTLSSATAAGASEAGAAANPSALDIEEFVPGKLWQGPSTKNVEDDPYITPGSVTRNTISAINDIQVMSILGKNNAGGGGGGPDSRSSSSLGKSGSSQNLQSPATALSNTWLNEPPPSLSVDPWTRNQGLPPPGLGMPNKPQWHYNRSVSWAPGDRTEYASMMNNWPGAPSNWLMIRNVTPQVENGTLQALCLQHGQVVKFFTNVIRGGAIVGYAKVEDAAKAQRSLHSCKLGSTQLIVDFITESDVAQLLDPNGRGGAAQQPQPSAFARPPLPSLGGAGAYSGLHPGHLNRPDMVAAAGQWGSTVGGTNSWNAGGGGSIGGGSSWPLGLEDHGAAYLPGDLLGGQ